MDRFRGSAPVTKPNQASLPGIKSKRGANRRYDAIMRQCYRDMAGGTQYGIDWPTLEATWPDRAMELRRIRSAYEYLPD